MDRKKMRISIWVYCGVLAAIVAGFAGLRFYCIQQTNTLRTYTFSADTLAQAQDGLSVSMTVSKQWTDDTLHPDIPTGAQYDGVLSNDSNRVFRNWSLKMTFSEDVVIDSSWNGTFATDGNTVTFAAEDLPDTDDDPSVVKAHGVSTFGSVMYSKDLMTLEGCTLEGYSVVRLVGQPLFWVLATALLVWLVALIVHFILLFRMRKYRERQALDSKIIKQSMETFTGFIDAKDPYTRGHSARVAAYTEEIARRMGMDADKVEQLYHIGLMHDCGKIGVPDTVLNKPGKLTRGEYEIIKSHTTLGDSILVNFTAIPGIRDGAHYHHERFDGKGYPTGLAGTDIPLCARIICVADSYDAMSSNRCYRGRLSDECIMEELTSNAGKQFDPDITAHMVAMIEDGFAAEVQERIPSGQGDAGAAKKVAAAS